MYSNCSLCAALILTFTLFHALKAHCYNYDYYYYGYDYSWYDDEYLSEGQALNYNDKGLYKKYWRCGGSIPTDGVIHWLKNGIVISVNENISTTVDDIDIDRYTVCFYRHHSLDSVLRISDISTQTAAFDSGYYQYVTYDSRGIEYYSSGIFPLLIYVTPSTYTPVCKVNTDTTVAVGQEVVVMCESESLGYPPIFHQWFMNGSNNEIEMSVMNTTPSALEPPNFPDLLDITDNGTVSTKLTWDVRKTDDGVTFTCVASNPRWSDTYSCDLGPFTVVWKPTVTVTPVHYIVSSSNQSATFTCNALGYPDTYTWRYDGDVIESDDTFIITNNSRNLRFTNFNNTSNGLHELVCEAGNIAGTGSMTAHLAVFIEIPTTTSIELQNTPAYKHLPVSITIISTILATIVGSIATAVCLLLIVKFRKLRRTAQAAQTPITSNETYEVVQKNGASCETENTAEYINMGEVDNEYQHIDRVKDDEYMTLNA